MQQAAVGEVIVKMMEIVVEIIQEEVEQDGSKMVVTMRIA
jgi:hypothetical protein